MQDVGIIERAFQLTPECRSLDELMRKLEREGYSQVIEHLRGPKIRSQITSLLKPRPGQANDESLS